MSKDELEILKDLYNACCNYENKSRGLMAWQLPSFYEAKKILAKHFPDCVFDNTGKLVYGINMNEVKNELFHDYEAEIKKINDL